MTLKKQIHQDKSRDAVEEKKDFVCKFYSLFSLLFEQKTLHLHFELCFTNSVASPASRRFWYMQQFENHFSNTSGNGRESSSSC